jgi:hypothetical protein
MKRPGIVLSREARVMACRAMGEALLFHMVELIDLCVGARHWHVLARFRPIDPERWDMIRSTGASENRDARHLMGIAKKESARALSRADLVAPGGVWAHGCGRRLIQNRAHQVAVARYIRAYATQGAAVWSLLQQ